MLQEEPTSISVAGQWAYKEACKVMHLVIRSASPKLTRRNTVPNGAATTNEGKVLLSGRHEGLAIYFGRLLSALLSSKIVRPA